MIISFPPQGTLFVLTRQERHALLHDTVAVSPDILHKIEAAPWDGESVRVWLDLDDLEELVNAVAWEANHATSQRRQRLFDDLYDHLAPILDRALGIDSGWDDDHPAREVFKDLLRIMAESEGDDPATIKERIARLSEQQNRRPLPELGGLSLEQAFLLNRSGWWADPFPIRLEPNLSLEQVGHTPFFHNVRAFLQAADEFKGAPTTAKGNLNRAFVAHMLELLALPPGRLEMIQRVCKVVNEPDVWALHIVRVVCQVGRLVRKYKKRFVVTRKARELLQEERAGALYHYLFHTMFREFNLDYISDWAEAPGIQATLPYELYRIGQLPLGQDHDIESLVPVVFVPALQQEIRTVSSHEDAPEWLLKDHLLRPLESFGLVQIVAEKAKPPSIDLTNRVRRLPLFDTFIRFPL